MDSPKKLAEGVVVIAPGFGESPRNFRQLAKGLVGAGYCVIRPWSHRWRNGRIGKAWKAENAKHPDRPFPKAQYRLAVGVIRQLDRVGARNTIGVAHSMGGIYLLIAAYLRPELFKVIHVVAAAGLLEGDSFLDVFVRVNRKTHLNFQLAKAQPELGCGVWTSFFEGQIYTWANPVRAWQEGRSAATFTTDWLIREVILKVWAVNAILGTDDNVYPPPETASEINRFDRLFSSWVLMTGPHDLWLYHEQLIKILLELTPSAPTSTAPEEGPSA